ncbi:MAG: neutral zinc metallopeptidase [Bacteroidota bacterium]
MKIDDRYRSDNVIDRRGGRRGAVRGGVGLGTLLLVLLIGYCTGIDPQALLGGAESVQSVREPTQSAGIDDEGRAFVEATLGYTEVVWNDLFRRSGSQYPEPKLVLFSGITRSACGTAQSATGPFYCPLDQAVYIDLDFYRQLQRFGASGDFALAYVIAHEVGHHVQNVEGTLSAVQSAQQRLRRRDANALSVRTELQADCYAGVWAYYAQNELRVLETGDLEEALGAAAAVGDDNLQQMSGRAMSVESFTHGSSQQRVDAFRAGLRSGDPGACDTFSDLR